MIGPLILLVGISYAISLVLTASMKHVAPALGLVAHPGERRIHATPTPMGGGVAIFLAVWIPIGMGLLTAFYLHKRGFNFILWPELASYVSGIVSLAPRLGIIFGGGLIIWLLGLADDRFKLSPWLRLTVEIGVVLALVWFGMNISIFIHSAAVRTLITVLWVVGLINAFNFLDNMDGLSSGVALIIAFFFCIVAVQTGHPFIAAFLCCLIGALGGFLTYNFPPAGIFMGDSGSMTIGYLLAIMTVEFTFFQPERPYFPVIVPLLMFGVPLFDMITVIWIRLRAGRSPFQGDTNHFSHRLTALGMSRRQAVLTIYLITATVALGATVLYHANSAAILVIFAQTVAVFMIIGILERARPNQARETKP